MNLSVVGGCWEWRCYQGQGSDADLECRDTSRFVLIYSQIVLSHDSVMLREAARLLEQWAVTFRKHFSQRSVRSARA